MSGRVATVTTRLIDSVLDLTVWLFAGWTVIYHGALVLDLSQSAAIGAMVVVGAVLVGLRLGLSNRAVAATSPRSSVPPPALLWASLGAAGVAAALMAARILSPPGWYVAWVIAALAVAPAAVWLWSAGRRGGDQAETWGGRPANPAGPSDGRGTPTPSMVAVVVVVLVAIGFGLLSMFTRRPDSDDSYLVNRALYAEGHAGSFATRDTMFSDEVFESVRPDVAPSSIEPFVGVLGRLSGINVQTLTFLVLGPLAATVGIFAAWRLVRTMRVRAPALVTAATAAFLVLDGVRHQSFGNFSFARSWQGKVVLVFVLVPLLWHYAITWSRDRSSTAGIGLVAANVAAVGLSSTGLVVAPVVAVLGVLAGDPRRVRGALPVLGLAVVYPLGALVLGSDFEALVGTAVTELASGSVIGRASSPEGGPIGEAASRSWYLVLGSGLPMGIAALSILGSWATVRDDAARRVLAFAATAVLIFFGPGLYRLGSAAFTVDSVYWRVLWIAPVPIMVGLTATVGLRWLLCRPAAATPVRWLAAAAVPLVVVGVLWTRGAPVTVETNLDLWVFDWDVDPDRRDAAIRAIELSEPGDVVAAPAPVGQPMTLLSVEVRPVNPEDRFLRGSHTTPGFRPGARLFTSASLETGLPEGEENRFSLALDALSVDTVCSYRQIDGDPVESVLADAGFVVVDQTATCTYWRR